MKWLCAVALVVLLLVAAMPSMAQDTSGYHDVVRLGDCLDTLSQTGEYLSGAGYYTIDESARWDAASFFNSLSSEEHDAFAGLMVTNVYGGTAEDGNKITDYPDWKGVLPIYEWKRLRSSITGESVTVMVYKWDGNDAEYYILPQGPVAEDGFPHPPAGCSIYSVGIDDFWEAMGRNG